METVWRTLRQIRNEAEQLRDHFMIERTTEILWEIIKQLELVKQIDLEKLNDDFAAMRHRMWRNHTQRRLKQVASSLLPTFTADKELLERYRSLEKEFQAIKALPKEEAIPKLKLLNDKFADLDERAATHRVRIAGSAFVKTLGYTITTSIALLALLYGIAVLGLIAPLPLMIIPATFTTSILISILAYVIMRKYPLILKMKGVLILLLIILGLLLSTFVLFIWFAIEIFEITAALLGFFSAIATIMVMWILERKKKE